MAQNNVQYQHGLPLLEFFETYGTHEQCEALVRAWRWPQGFICPRCAQTRHSEFRRASRVYFQCSACCYQCSLVSGTIFESSKVSLPNWFAAMHLISQAKNNVCALELKRHLGVSYPTGWLKKHKITEVMRLRESDRDQRRTTRLVCFAQAPFTKKALSDFVAKSLARPLTVVSDGLVCFTALQEAGVHEVTVTGGGPACVRLP